MGDFRTIAFTYGGFDSEWNYRFGRGESVLYVFYAPLSHAHRGLGFNIGHMCPPLKAPADAGRRNGANDHAASSR
jgi:hypothetical protein